MVQIESILNSCIYHFPHLFRVFLSPFECRSDLCGAVFLSFCIKYYARAIPLSAAAIPHPSFQPAHWKYFDFTFIEI